jgi:hypothetical protein
MQAAHDKRTVDDLIQLKSNHMLTANPEYQRGAVWTVAQKKRLVDSLLRGYPIPLIYLHHISKVVAGAKREDFEIIDGQQRLNALYEYREGSFKLFDPKADASEAQFPTFIQDQPCPWGGKRFEELSPELQTQMLETPLAVVLIETDIANEARDLFIRLQAGMPLNSQEKRDAWPGKFTEYILKVAGKPELARYPGHDFFKRVMKARDKNRGEFRQQGAQIVMLHQTRIETGKLCDINKDAIDVFYHKNLDFDPHSPHAKRLDQILGLLDQTLGDGKRKKVIAHEAMGLVLLVDSLLDDYTKSWTDELANAFDTFKQKVAEATKARFDNPNNVYWSQYGQWTRSNSDRAETIERRHTFFVEKMYKLMKSQLKDPERIFGSIEREIIYYRDRKKCQRQGCNGDVVWADGEIHHVEQHSNGGKTNLANGALVHKGCHPKSQKDVAAFAEAWKGKGKAAGV